MILKENIPIINTSFILVEYHYQPEEMFNRDRIYWYSIIWG